MHPGRIGALIRKIVLDASGDIKIPIIPTAFLTFTFKLLSDPVVLLLKLLLKRHLLLARRTPREVCLYGPAPQQLAGAMDVQCAVGLRRGRH